MTKKLLFIFLIPLLVMAQSKIPDDTVQVGKGSTSSDKGVIFNTNDGASNPTLKVVKATKLLKYDKDEFQIGDATAGGTKKIKINGANKAIQHNGTTGRFGMDDDLDITGEATTTGKVRAGTTLESAGNLDVDGDTATFGDGTNSVKQIKADIGAGANNPYFKWDSATNTWKFSNDGSTEKAIGSGGGAGGGSGGINLLANESFEDGVSTGWTNSGGTFSSQTFTNGITDDTKYARFVASGAAQYFESTAKAIPDSFQGGCQADFKGVNIATDDLFKVEVFDGSSNLLATANVKKSAWAKLPRLVFPCPLAAVTVKIRVTSLAAGTIEVDHGYVGSNQGIIQTSPGSQSSFFHTTSGSGSTDDNTVIFTTNVENNGSGVYTTNFASQAVNGLVITMTKAARIQAVFCLEASGVPNTHYGIGYNATGSTDYNTLTYATGQRGKIGLNNTNSYQCNPAEFDAAAGSTVRPMWGSNAPAYNATSQFMFRAIPVDQEQQAYSEDQAKWLIDVNIGGGNTSLGSVSSYTEITNATWDLVNNTAKGSASDVQIACATGTASTGTTCSSNESLGIAFTPPYPGTFQVCAALNFGTDGAAAVQLVETNNADTTILQEGGERIGMNGFTSGANSMVHICGNFIFGDVSKKTIRFMYESNSASNQTYLDRSSTIGQRDAHFTVFPSTANIARPVLIGASKLISQIKWQNVASCNPAVTAGTYTTLNDTDCTFGSATKIGATVVTPTTTGDISLKVSAVPTGKYIVGVHGDLYTNSVTLNRCKWRLYDGTNKVVASNDAAGAGTSSFGMGFSEVVEYTSPQTNLEWKLQVYQAYGTGGCQAIANTDDDSIRISLIQLDN